MVTDVFVMSSCKLLTTQGLHAGLALRSTYKEGERFGLKLNRRLELAVKSTGPDEFNPQDPHERKRTNSQKLSFNLHMHAEVQAHKRLSTRTDIHVHTK